MLVFDKWGKEVFSTTSYTKARNEGWNGKNKDGDLQQSGVYTFVLRGKFLNNNDFERTGTVTLIR